MEIMPTDTILDSLFDGVYCVDADRRITYWNAGAERITGFSRAEVKGYCCADNLLRHIDANGCELCRDDCPLAVTILNGNPVSRVSFPAEVIPKPVTQGRPAAIGAKCCKVC